MCKNTETSGEDLKILAVTQSSVTITNYLADFTTCQLLLGYFMPKSVQQIGAPIQFNIV